MTVGIQAYPEGMDCVWLASDSAGHVGAFVTGGCGPVPVDVLRDQVPIEEFELKVLQLPQVSAACLAQSPGDLSSYEAIALRGIFAFDWTDVHKTAHQTGLYERLAGPARPIRIHDLPVDLAGLLPKIADVEFLPSQCVDIRSRFECLPRLK